MTSAPALMTAAEELALIERWRAGDQRALDKLIREHQPLVQSAVRTYRSFSYEDLIQEGNVGLMLALQKFDPSKGYRFNTYARWWIKAAITEYTAENRGQIAVPRAKPGKPPKDRPLYVELDRPLPYHPTNRQMTAADIIPADQPSPEEITIRSGEVQRLRRSMRKLKPRDRFVIEQRMDEDTTLREIGLAIGVTHERVRQIEQRALRSLKADLTMPRAVGGRA